MAKRVIISLSGPALEIFKSLPDGSRSSVVRNLLEAYASFAKESPAALSYTLRNRIKLEESKNDTR